MLVVGTLVVFGSLGLARFGYTMVLPSMQAGLGLSNAETGGLATANLIGYLVLAASGGALAAHLGPRLVISVGLALAGAGMIATGLASGFGEAAAWRALTGIGSGASNVPVLGLLAAWFARERRGLASGVAVAGSSLGLMFVGPVVPRVLEHVGGAGWRACWYLFGGLTLALAVLALAVLRNRPGDGGLLAHGAWDLASEPGAARPAGWRDVYRAPAIWRLGLVYVAFGFSYMIYMTFFVKRLLAEGGYSKEAAGALFMLMGWCSLPCGPLWGGLSDRIGRQRALALVYALHAVAFALFALWPARAGFTVSAVLFGLSAWSIPAIMAAACGDALGPRLAPAGLGFVTLFFGAGQASGPAVAGALADACGGSFAPAYLLAAAVAAAGCAGAAAEIRTEREGRTT